MLAWSGRPGHLPCFAPAPASDLCSSTASPVGCATGVRPSPLTGEGWPPWLVVGGPEERRASYHAAASIHSVRAHSVRRCLGGRGGARRAAKAAAFLCKDWGR